MLDKRHKTSYIDCMILINETIIFIALTGYALSSGSYILAGIFGVFWFLNAINDGE